MQQSCHYTTTAAAQESGGCANCQCGAAQPCPPPVPPCPPPYPPYPPMPPMPPCGECVDAAQPAAVSCGCDCAPGMLAALQLLCGAHFAPLVDYAQFAFITRAYVLGSSLRCPESVTTAYDNLTGPLDGEFVKLSADTCDDLSVSGQIYYPNPISSAGAAELCAAGPYFSADSVRLCALTAVAFGVATSTDYPSTAEAFAALSRLFYQATHGGGCGSAPTPPSKPTPCDRSNGTLSGRGSVSVTAGPLLIGNASVLGELGEVLILANSADERIYFVCRSAIGFIG